MTYLRCHKCGLFTHVDDLDGKPARFADGKQTKAELSEALDNNENCDFIACEACYGEGYVSNRRRMKSPKKLLAIRRKIAYSVTVQSDNPPWKSQL